MGQMTSSRSQTPHNEQRTIQALLDEIMADEEIHLLKRRDLCSGVRSLCRRLHVQIESTPADPRRFAETLRGVTPATVGMSKGRFQNCRSHLDAAFAWADAQFQRRRRSRELQPDYQNLLAKVDRKFDRINLRRLIHFLADHEIHPKSVDEGVLSRFSESLMRSSIVRARFLDRNTRKLWNRLHETVPGWPGHKVEMPSYVDHYVLPTEAFPSSLWQDVEAYISWRISSGTQDLDSLLSDDELFAEGAPRQAAPIRTSTAQLVRYRVRQFASALVYEKVSLPEDFESLAKLVPVARVNAGLRFFIRRAGSKRENSQIRGIASDLVQIAELWVHSPPSDIAKLRIMASRVRPKHDGLPESARRSLAPFRDPSNVRAFLGLSDRLVHDLQKAGKPNCTSASRMAAALWIKIAQRAPLRISNLLSTDIDRNIIRTPGKNGGVSLYYPAEQVKNDKPLEVPLPSATVAMLDLYLQKYRPLLKPGNSSRLFLGTDGSAKRSNSMSILVQVLMRNNLGFAINPHSFRHVAAKLYLSVHPGDYETVQRLLGHKSRQTTLKYYCELEAEEAFRHFDAILLGLQSETEKGSRR